MSESALFSEVEKNTLLVKFTVATTDNTLKVYMPLYTTVLYVVQLSHPSLQQLNAALYINISTRPLMTVSRKETVEV